MECFKLARGEQLDYYRGMKKNRKPLIVGNWKANPASYQEAKAYVATFKRFAPTHPGIDIVLCPPAPFVSGLAVYLGKVKENIKKSSKGSAAAPKKGVTSIGAQDVSEKVVGSHTGDVTSTMLESSGAEYVIIGHSERRAQGETDTLVATKVQQLLKTDMTAIICIGESVRDEQGEYLEFVRGQLIKALSPVARHQFSQIIIAYEPIWAIGRADNVAMGPHDVHQMALYIRKFFREQWGEAISTMVPILYGGSVNESNAHDILYKGEVDGLLVGRASFASDTFAALIKAIDPIKGKAKKVPAPKKVSAFKKPLASKKSAPFKKLKSKRK